MNFISYEKIPDSIRVDMEQAGLPGFHVLVIPEEHPPFRGIWPWLFGFYLVNEDTGVVIYMFSSYVRNPDEAANIAVINAPQYTTPYETE